MPTSSQNPTNRCPACGYPASVVFVHGHGQCSVCGTNIEPCCGGAPCPSPWQAGLVETREATIA